MTGGFWPKLSVEKPNSFRVRVGEIKAKHRGNWQGINVMSNGGGVGTKSRIHALTEQGN